jgi:hypothetical protein
MALTLEQFARDFRQSVLADANVEDAEGFEENVFTRAMMDRLAEAGEMTDGQVCRHSGKLGRVSVRVSGYAANDDEDLLDVVVSLYSGTAKATRVEKVKVDAAFKQAQAFVKSAADGGHNQLEEAAPAFELAQIIHSLTSGSDPDVPKWRMRIFLLTNGLVGSAVPPINETAGLSVSYHVRDLRWLYNWDTSLKAPNKIEIDLAAFSGGPLPCLKMPVENSEYQTYLAIVPGELLLNIYSEYGARLLERNVRSFLQARGAVNSGIRKTLREEPHRFLAYNNGLTATAESVHLTSDGTAITHVSDLQIVNGGQTTASIFHAARRDRADLSGVYVPLKLSVVHDTARLEEFVSFTAQYANSQNKINIADFSANSPFHRSIETLSRGTWAPPAKGQQHQTRWFYERARGQFADARSYEKTSAKLKVWDKIHPREQSFSKTDLAKFETTWMQRPHVVSRGAQTCFTEFTDYLGKRADFEPGTHYFEHLCAKAILFRRAEKIIGAMKYGGYRANIVTYTLAYLCHATEGRLNLDAIWKTQDISPALQKAIQSVSKHVHAYIIEPPGGANVTQWCKRESCWKGLRDLNIPIPAGLQKELIALSRSA